MPLGKLSTRGEVAASVSDERSGTLEEKDLLLRPRQAGRTTRVTDQPFSKTSSNGEADVSQLLLNVLAQPTRMVDLSLRNWDRLLRIAQRTGMWSHLAVQVDALGLGDRIPEPVRPHIESALNIAAASRRSIAWETSRLEIALGDVDSPIVLLKGAAYAICGLPFAAGRLSCDLDVLVARSSLDEAEAALRRHGWAVDEDNPFHDAYYRRWLHEIPPMRHQTRNSVIDLHHTILPLTDRLHVEPGLLLQAAKPVEGSRFSVLSPADMVVHCATHLFRKGDFSHGLRDLYDLDSLLRHFGESPTFWEEFLRRAALLNLTLPCSYALRYVVKYFGTPIPPKVAAEVDRWKSQWTMPVMDRLVDRALFPRDPLNPEISRSLAIWWLQFWPPPRWRSVFTWDFWSKRFGGTGRSDTDAHPPDNQDPGPLLG